MRLKFVVAYDGTDFCGWAANAGHRTVHGVLSEAVQRVCGEAVEIVGASRTDSGAHARGQVCHFDTGVPIEASKWPLIVNRVLPPDVAVLRAYGVGEDFNSRFCAEDRWYRYRIRTAGRDPFAGRFAHDFGQPLDIPAMRRVAELLVGRHDFLAFTANLQPHVENTFRTIRRVKVRQKAGEVWIDIGGTAFLRGMMRRMSGCLQEVGEGRRSIESVAKLLDPSREPIGEWPVVLPAKGLCLMRIRYGNPPKDHRNDGES
jgi:tRNA pseudouridine38-40 synthase